MESNNTGAPANNAESALLRDVEVAVVMGCSRSMIHKLHRSGKLPEAIRLGRCLRWRREEIKNWIAAGAPPLVKWIVLKGGRA